MTNHKERIRKQGREMKVFSFLVSLEISVKTRVRWIGSVRSSTLYFCLTLHLFEQSH